MAARGSEQTELPNLEDGVGVVEASYPRRVQGRGRYDVSIPKEWAKILDIATQGEPVEARFVTGANPVVIDGPAIVYRPHPNGGNVDE